MENNQRKEPELDQNPRTGKNSDGLLERQENNESLNTASAEQQPVQNLRDAAAGSGRSYDYDAQSSPEQGTDGSR